MRQIVVLLVLLIAFFMACDTTTTPPTTVTTTKDATETSKKGISSGALLYRQRCVTCHGANGRMGNNGAKVLPESPLNVAQRIEVVTYGRNIMPAFENMMTKEEIEAVVQFTMTL